MPKKIEPAVDLQEQWPGWKGATLKWGYWWGVDSKGVYKPREDEAPITIAKVNPADVVLLGNMDSNQQVFRVLAHRDWWNGLTEEQQNGAAAFVMSRIVWNGSGSALTLETDAYSHLYNAVRAKIDLTWMRAWDRFVEACAELAPPKEQMSFEDVEAEAVA